LDGEPVELFEKIDMPPLALETIKMYRGSGTVDKIGRKQLVDAAGAGQMLLMHSSDGSTFVQEITSWPPF